MGKNVKKREYLFAAGGNVSQYNYYGKEDTGLSKSYKQTAKMVI